LPHASGLYFAFPGGLVELLVRLGLEADAVDAAPAVLLGGQQLEVVFALLDRLCLVAAHAVHDGPHAGRLGGGRGCKGGENGDPLHFGLHWIDTQYLGCGMHYWCTGYAGARLPVAQGGVGPP